MFKLNMKFNNHDDIQYILEQPVLQQKKLLSELISEVLILEVNI